MDKSAKLEAMKRFFLLLSCSLALLLFPTNILAQPAPADVCNDFAAGSPERQACVDCVTGVTMGGASGTYVWTAIGCLEAGNPNHFIGQILGWSTIIGAGIAFLLIVFGGFQITTAAGDPKRVKAAQELITAAIMGLLLIIFSIFLLNLIGIKILNLPGFPTPNP